MALIGGCALSDLWGLCLVNERTICSHMQEQSLLIGAD